MPDVANVRDRSKLALGYVRLSKIDTDPELHHPGLGLEAQRETIRQYCNRQGFKLLGIFEDADVSGGEPLERRLRGAELARQVRHPDCRGVNVIAARLDRMFRRPADALDWIERFRKLEVRLHLCDLPTQDLSSPAGIMFLGVLAVIADWERRMIAERTRGALRYRKSRNMRFSGKMPLGWRLDEDGTTLRPFMPERAALGRMWEWHSKGLSNYAVANELDGEFKTRTGKPWSTGTIRNCLKRLRNDERELQEAVLALRWWEGVHRNPELHPLPDVKEALAMRAVLAAAQPEDKRVGRDS